MLTSVPSGSWEIYAISSYPTLSNNYLFFKNLLFLNHVHNFNFFLTLFYLFQYRSLKPTPSCPARIGDHISICIFKLVEKVKGI